MNPKIDKLAKEIAKAETKISELQKKVVELKEQKTELENYDYGEIGRSFNFSPKELAEFLKAQQIKPTLPPGEGNLQPHDTGGLAMKNKTIALLIGACALHKRLCFAVQPLSLPAATIPSPPTLTAKLDGETLNIEASDDISGVEAVYVDETRVNLLVNGNASVALKDYAGDEKQVVVYAVDYSGNRSQEVKLDNPYYEEPDPIHG